MVDEPQAEFGSLVVVGASAGGIEALTKLLGSLSPSFPAPIVVAQHTNPLRESHLGEILQSRTRLPVVTLADRQALRGGTVYLVPHDHHILITDHTVEPREAKGDHPSPSVDRLLTSAADVFGERLIAVILSGMGQDGVLGAGDVKAHGGTVIIQNPETAAQPSMPRALPPTLVDFVANAERMGELLLELATTPPGPVDDEERLLAQFLDRIRERTGIDFSAYKRPTVRRRLQRRMVATANPRLRDYIRFVQRHPEEYQRPSATFLIKVTQFFRDADLFDHIRSAILPGLIEEARGRDHELRIWSAGCATGEEAYSLAVLIADTLGDEHENFTVRIFATDLDEEAISYARRGIYPASALGTVRPELLGRWFMRNGDQYEVSKEIRSMVVFGQHDLGQRAPFPRIDLALCRNVLIYFTPELQKRALQLFAFSLREGGFLVLGKAESTTPFAEYFVLEQPRLKVYRRVGDRVLIPPARVHDSTPIVASRPVARREPSWASAQPGSRGMRDAPRTTGERADDLLLRLPVGVVVIDRSYDISFINSEARKIIGIHGTAIGSDFIHLANRLPSEDLRSAVAEAIARASRVVTRPLEIQNDEGGSTTHVRLTLQPYGPVGGDGPNSVLVTIVDVSDAVLDRRELEVELGRSREDQQNLARRLEGMGRSHRELMQANEEMTNANAGLRIANEELLVANEEVQAATEEVETLNEELQATNEELETLNEELQATVEELNTTNDDLEARSTELTETAASLVEQRHRSEVERQRLALILDGMTDAVMVVDRAGEVVATNRAFEEQFRGGLPIPQDASGANLPEDQWPQARAACGESFSMSFTRADSARGERRWYEATGHAGPGEGGAVIVIRDITDRSLRHVQEHFIDAASHELQTPLAALHNYLQLTQRALGKGSGGDEADRYLSRAIEQSRVLADLASRLFDVSLIRHGRIVVARKRTSLRDVLLAAVDEVRMASPEAALQVRSGRARGVVLGDALRLRQMLTNLLRNAVTHGASEHPVEVSMALRGGRVEVVVADRGPGLPASVHAHLFSPFVSGEGGTGLGLGLYLARAIAVEHGGGLEIEPRAGGGTEARVQLPLADGGAR